MEIGLALPNIGPQATPEVLFPLIDKAEELGFDTVWTGDHLALPRKPELPYPYSRGKPRYLDADNPILDPLVVMAAVIGRTRRIRVGVSVLILPYRHPLITAKMIASMDALGPGRVILGVGVGWIPEEFVALDADLKKRGAVTDEQMRYFKELWSKDDPQHQGEFYRYSGLGFYPKPQGGNVPLWVGGNTIHAMRRAAKLGDGLHLIDLTPEELEEHVVQFRQVCADLGRAPEEIALSIRSSVRFVDDLNSDRTLPITGTVEQVVADLRRFEELGVSHVCLGPRPMSLNVDDMLDAVDVIGKEVIPALR